MIKEEANETYLRTASPTVTVKSRHKVKQIIEDLR